MHGAPQKKLQDFIPGASLFFLSFDKAAIVFNWSVLINIVLQERIFHHTNQMNQQIHRISY